MPDRKPHAVAIAPPPDMLPEIVRAGCLSLADETLWVPLGNDSIRCRSA